MSKKDFLFTSESVTEGHPDKIADQISDAVLDAIMAEDPMGRVACETLVTTGLAFVAGEISTSCYVNIPKIVRNTIKEIGYTRASYGFDYETCAVITSIDEQSQDIAMGVNPGGAGDQGLMFGYASDETEEYMPLPIMLAHKLTMQLTKARREEILPYLRPDGKSQVTVEYVNGKPRRIDTVVISSQHSADISLKELREGIIEKVIIQPCPYVPGKIHNRIFAGTYPCSLLIIWQLIPYFLAFKHEVLKIQQLGGYVCSFYILTAEIQYSHYWYTNPSGLSGGMT